MTDDETTIPADDEEQDAELPEADEEQGDDVKNDEAEE